jgi:mannose-6-phosphate isomerase-like protein (cupin superfamily)
MAGELERVALENFGNSITVDLPGEQYERFMLSKGAFCEWKSAPCDVGRAVMFKAHGETAMGSHKHESPEILIVKSGELVVRVAGVPHTLKAGDTITTEAGQEHSAHYIEPGETLCIWPALSSERMTVDVLA